MKEEKTTNDTISTGVLVVGSVSCGLAVLGSPVTAVCFVGGELVRSDTASPPRDASCFGFSSPVIRCTHGNCDII